MIDHMTGQEMVGILANEFLSEHFGNGKSNKISVLWLEKTTNSKLAIYELKKFHHELSTCGCHFTSIRKNQQIFMLSRATKFAFTFWKSVGFASNCT